MFLILNFLGFTQLPKLALGRAAILEKPPVTTSTIFTSSSPLMAKVPASQTTQNVSGAPLDKPSMSSIFKSGPLMSKVPATQRVQNVFGAPTEKPSASTIFKSSPLMTRAPTTQPVQNVLVLLLILYSIYYSV